MGSLLNIFGNKINELIDHISSLEAKIEEIEKDVVTPPADKAKCPCPCHKGDTDTCFCFCSPQPDMEEMKEVLIKEMNGWDALTMSWNDLATKILAFLTANYSIKKLKKGK